MLTLLAPDPGPFRSGGHIYNQRMGMELAEKGFRLRHLPNPAPEVSALPSLGIERESLLLLDSLYFEEEEWLRSVSAVWKKRLALLVHYLPSTDPGLPGDVARRLRKAEASALSRAGKIVATSGYMASVMERLFPDAPRAVVVRPGVDRSFRDARHARKPVKQREEGGEIRLLTVANWTEGKNHAFLLPVLHQLKKLPWNWKIIGETEGNEKLADDFRKIARRFGLDGRIDIAGPLPPESVPGELAEADLFLFPSRFESYGMALAEALSAGVPAVAGRVGGTEEVCAGRKGVLLIDPGNAGAWRALLERLLGDRGTLTELAGAARQAAPDFPDWRESAELLYSSLEAP